jgi:hypothetical protein
MPVASTVPDNPAQASAANPQASAFLPRLTVIVCPCERGLVSLDVRMAEVHGPVPEYERQTSRW